MKGREERWDPLWEQVEVALLTPVLDDAIVSWRVEVSYPMKLFVVVLGSNDYCGKWDESPHLSTFPLELVDV